MNNNAEAEGVAALALLISAGLLAGVIAIITTVGVQSDRDARRLDVIEQRLNIRGPDAPTLTVDDLIATAVAEANK